MSAISRIPLHEWSPSWADRFQRHRWQKFFWFSLASAAEAARGSHHSGDRSWRNDCFSPAEGQQWVELGPSFIPLQTSPATSAIRERTSLTSANLRRSW